MESLEAVRAYFRAWAARDAAGVLATLAEGATYEDPTTQGPVSGAAFASHMAGLWTAFPDLAFEERSLGATGPGHACAEWTMTGTNAGSFAGLPPTGRSVRLPGVDVFTLREGAIRSVTGYFDTAAVPRQLGLDVIVQPRAVGPFGFGTSVMVQTGATREPGAFSITFLEALDEAAALEVREGSSASMIDMLGMEGFIGATAAKIGTRMVTISAWDSPEDSRRVMKEGAHAAAMRGFYDGTLAKGGYTSVWTKHRMNPSYVRCDACGRMHRDPAVGAVCGCGAQVPERLPFW
jgi:steroid delta-isomerase-like uncharacterized protein